MSLTKGPLKRALDAPIDELSKSALAPVVVAVLDSGIDGSHPDLAGRVVRGMAFEADAEGNVASRDSDPTRTTISTATAPASLRSSRGLRRMRVSSISACLAETTAAAAKP